ncbi:MAG TPA: SOS response-associated peptidase [Planctomycetota bacterium]|nr:SOS response-associated peptidase [Planctomycetota bacterium]
MCGRYTLATTYDELREFFQLDDDFPLYSARYNIAPTQPVLAVRDVAVLDGEKAAQKRRVAFFSWGLVPSWSKDPRLGAKLINARAETLAEKPAFRTAFKRRRCLVPADGFYEWQRSGRRKQAFHIRLRREKLFAFAGIFDEWHGPNGELLETCAIVTTEANDLMRPIHERMPVILRRGDYGAWLDKKNEDTDALLELLTAYPSEEMVATAVGDFVNSAQHEGAACLERAKEMEGEGMLF